MLVSPELTQATQGCNSLFTCMPFIISVLIASSLHGLFKILAKDVRLGSSGSAGHRCERMNSLASVLIDTFVDLGGSSIPTDVCPGDRPPCSEDRAQYRGGGPTTLAHDEMLKLATIEGDLR